MSEFIKVCESRYGRTTCIYYYVNPNQIVELHIEQDEYEVNVEASLTNGQRVILLDKKDLVALVGEEKSKEIIIKMEELAKERGRYK